MSMNDNAVREMTSHPRWVSSLYEFVAPHWDNLVNGQWAQSVASAQFSVEQMQGWILQIYPFIYDFPKFLAEGLIKVEDDFSRTFLIENIRIERAHAEHWIWMGEGFGLDRQKMLDLAEGEVYVTAPGAEIDEGHELVGAIDAAHEEVFGEPPGRDVTRWFSDASALTRYGIPTVNYGTSTGLMDVELGENLEIDGLVKTAEVYARVAARVCGVA